jgi:hypothetical protein
MNDLSDVELVEKLEEVDNDSSISVTSWEAEFIQSMFDIFSESGKRKLTERQRAVIITILGKYKS